MRSTNVQLSLMNQFLRAVAAVLSMVALPACESGPAGPPPPELRLETRGRLERGLEVELLLLQDGAAAQLTGVTYQADPAGSAEFLPGARVRLLQAGTIRITATASGRSASVSIVVASPPKIVFDLARDGNSDIYVAALDGGEMTRLTTHAAQDRDPTVAGGVVVFSSNRDGVVGLYSVPLAGGTERRLVAAASQPALSPDGRRLAFTREAGEVTKLWTAAADGTGATRYDSSVGFSGSVEGGPTWAPASDRLALMTTHGGSADIWVYPMSGEPSPLVVNPRADVEPAWSPDGQQVAFVSNRDGDVEVYVVQVSTREVRRLTQRAGTDARPAWLADGRLVYVAFGGDTATLRWLDPVAPATSYAVPIGAGVPGYVEGVR